MKRKVTQLDEDEARLSQLLFTKTRDLAERLKTEENIVGDLDIKPAWLDEDDEEFRANLLPNVKSKVAYTEKLKQKYETLMGTPNWAKLNREDTADDDEDKVLRTVGHLKKFKTCQLQKGFLEIKKLPRTINTETHNEGPIITCVEFHPKMSISLVAGHSGIASIFAVGKDVNTKLHSFKLKNWKTTYSQFSPDGNEAYIFSKLHHNFCIYDLVKAQPSLIQFPRLVHKPTIFKVSSDGKYIATSVGYDEVYIISISSRELLRTLKNNSTVQTVTFSHDCQQLYCYGVEGQVTIWDLSTFRAIKKFYDQGCVTASCITTSPCGKLLATGSGEGIVNIYETSKLTTSEPLPEKVISNLRTKITGLRFNATSEILATSSSLYPNAVKLVHLPSYNVFYNFPDDRHHLFQVETVNFSPNSGYMALSNNKNCAYLYRLKYYKNY